MGRNLKRRTAVPVYRFDFDTLSESDWVSMTQGDRLMGGGKVSRRTMYTWTAIGARLSWLPRGQRLVLPSFTRNGLRYTTKDAYLWWLNQQQEPVQ